jgi:hypothetical protein
VLTAPGLFLTYSGRRLTAASGRIRRGAVPPHCELRFVLRLKLEEGVYGMDRLVFPGGLPGAMRCAVMFGFEVERSWLIVVTPNPEDEPRRCRHMPTRVSRAPSTPPIFFALHVQCVPRAGL